MNITFQHLCTADDFKYWSGFLSLLVTPAVTLLRNQIKRVSDLSNSAKMELDQLQKKSPSKFNFFLFLFFFFWLCYFTWLCVYNIQHVYSRHAVDYIFILMIICEHYHLVVDYIYLYRCNIKWLIGNVIIVNSDIVLHIG